MDMVRGGEVGKMNWEIRTDIHTLPCVKQIASGKLLYNMGSSAQCSGMTQQNGMRVVGGRFRRQGTHVHLWLIHVVVQQKPTQRC